MRRRAWPPDAYWTIDLEDEDHVPVIVGPERWVKHCQRSPGWMTRQWRAQDWEVKP